MPMPKGHEVRPLRERFRSKHVKAANGCWLWTAATNNQGYGVMRILVDGRQVNRYAHRISFELHHGTTPGDHCVMHTCDTPACVNPDHLRLGTMSDNTADMVAKGRARGWPKGVPMRHRRA